MTQKIVDPGRQIAKIMHKDAELIDDCDSLDKMLQQLSETNTKIHMIIRGLKGDVN